MTRLLSILSLIVLACPVYADFWDWWGLPALPVELRVTPDVPKPFARNMAELIKGALSIVEDSPPPGYEKNLLHWTGDRSTLANKEFEIIFATTKSPDVAQLLAHYREKLPDSFTLELKRNAGKVSIATVLLVDQIFYDPAGEERYDGFAQLVLELGRMVYGPVEQMLGERSSVNQQRSCFRASLMFLATLLKSNQFLLFPQDVQRDLRNLVPVEINTFRKWQKANPRDDEPDPSLDDALRSLTS